MNVLKQGMRVSLWFNCVLQGRICWSPKFQNLRRCLFGDRVFINVIKLHEFMWVGLISIWLVSLKEEGQRHLGRRKRMRRHTWEMTAMWQEQCVCKPRNTSMKQRAEAGIGKDGVSPESSERARPCCHLRFGLLIFSTVTGYTSIVLNYSVLGALLPQSWETNTNTDWG